MKELLVFAYTLSRPKFWGYLAGPYVVGYAVGIDSLTQLFSPFFLFHLLYFLFVANIYVYGLNDLFDRDTDQFNTKKETKEKLLEKANYHKVYILVFISVILSCITVINQPSVASVVFLLIFLFLSGIYSVPPFRLKARPFFDFASNVHYAIPAFLAYNQMTGLLPSVPVFIAAFCWTGSMHLFSAIPDIVPDKKAAIKTTAVVLGVRNSLILCTILWSMCCAILFSNFGFHLLTLLSLAYPIICVFLLFRPNHITQLYWFFPYLNTITGGVLFWVMFLR